MLPDESSLSHSQHSVSKELSMCLTMLTILASARAFKGQSGLRHGLRQGNEKQTGATHTGHAGSTIHVASPSKAISATLGSTISLEHYYFKPECSRFFARFGGFFR
eukprot:226000-Pleurochrysis_carterae.AAC.1